MERNMKGNGRMGNLMDKEHTLFLMEEVLLGYGKIVLPGTFLDTTKKVNSLIMLMEKRQKNKPFLKPPPSSHLSNPN